MRILYFDIDTLRADHLGCYGYHRNTSPNIDKVAEQGIRFDNCYATDTPCLTSRSALFRGSYGIHTGCVSHASSYSDAWIEGPERGFRQSPDLWSWPTVFEKNGFYTVSVSPFAERHAAWWFYEGFREMFNSGKGGGEIADEIMVYAEKWLNENAEKDNWFLHINVWDPHTPYKVPMEYGNPFKDDPPPDWHTKEILEKNVKGYGAHCALDPAGFGPNTGWSKTERVPDDIKTMEDYKMWIDGYDTGIRYADDALGKTLNILQEKNVLEDTVIIISSDHGESQGELNIYGDHQSADNIVNRVPFVLRWPGLQNKKLFSGFFYQMDLAATILELAGLKVPKMWDGKSFARNIKDGNDKGRDHLVISHCPWSCQRSVVFEDWLLMQTYHTGLKDFPEIMLFKPGEDPHQLNDLASKNTDVVSKGLKLMAIWHKEMMETATVKKDPMDQVLEEGGPFHTRGCLEPYIKRLEETNRKEHAETLRKFKGKPPRKMND